MRVSGLFLYPVKGLQGVAVDEAVLEARGLAGDRRWMVADPAGRFLTRREVPLMARVRAAPIADGVLLSHAALGSCAVATPAPEAPAVAARIWRDTVTLRDAGEAAATFLSAALERPVRLLHQPDEARRAVAPDRGESGDHVSLADGLPLLLTSEASLAALNAALAQPVLMARFRPNIVIAGGEPWAEDGWPGVRIGAARIVLGQPCARCVVVTQDVETGAREDGNEPLTTLRRLGRAAPGAVFFGQNGIGRTLGRIARGDAVEPLA